MAVKTNKSLLKLRSYNCRGFSAVKKEFISRLTKNAGILLLQEHWLNDSQLNLLNSADPNRPMLSVGYSVSLALIISIFFLVDLMVFVQYFGILVFDVKCDEFVGVLSLLRI